MQLLHLPHRRLKADEVLTLADAEGLQMHNDLVVTGFDVRTGCQCNQTFPLLNLECFVRETLTAHARQRSHMPHYKQKRR